MATPTATRAMLFPPTTSTQPTLAPFVGPTSTPSLARDIWASIVTSRYGGCSSLAGTDTEIYDYCAETAYGEAPAAASYLQSEYDHNGVFHSAYDYLVTVSHADFNLAFYTATVTDTDAHAPGYGYDNAVVYLGALINAATALLPDGSPEQSVFVSVYSAARSLQTAAPYPTATSAAATTSVTTSRSGSGGNRAAGAPTVVGVLVLGLLGLVAVL